MLDHDNPFGLLAFLHWNHSWNQFHIPNNSREKAIRQIKDLGVSFVRLDILWSDVHRGQFQYEFSEIGQLIKNIRKQGIQILGVLHYNKWVEKDGREIWNQPPESFEEFAAYVGATVSEFKSEISHWEIWNEPNLSPYWAGPKDGLKSYSKLFKLSSEAAKKSNPHSIILNGGLTQPLLEDIQHLYENDCGPFFDKLNIHLFLNPHDKEAKNYFHFTVQKIINIMEKYGDKDKAIWITEFGCPGLPQKIKPQGWFAGEGTSEEQQKEWVNNMGQWIKEHSQIEKLFWAFYRDTNNMFKEDTDYFGLVRHDFSLKPAYKEYQRVIRNWEKNNSAGNI